MISYPNAKINIGLNIVGKRPDGYHDIETLFYPIGLCDVLEVSTSTSCADYSFSVSGISVDGNSDNNLVIKAYQLIKEHYDVQPVDISLIKNIPIGAGLGGGSADAAFMIKTLNNLFNLKISVNDLEMLAAKLGADCPFFIKNMPVYATGIGNIFSEIDFSLKGRFLILVKPQVHISTNEAYSNVNPKQPFASIKDLVKYPISEWKHHIINDFEESVFRFYPRIEEIKNNLYHLGAEYASMSGSGSSVYGIFELKPDINKNFENCFVSCGILD